jgi:glycosyltransferase involved in cell wall biosynthesis
VANNRWHRIARRAGAGVERALARRRVRPRHGSAAPHGPLPVTFLVWNAFAMGGTVRTVLRQADALVDRGHAVTVVSVIRHEHQQDPFFTTDPRVRIEVLVDRHTMGAGRAPSAVIRRWLDDQPAPGSQVSWGREAQGSLLTELHVLARVLRTRGVIIGTRVGLNLAIARFGHPAALKVGQEHLEFTRYDDTVKRAMIRHFRRLDVLACLTETGARPYRRKLEGASTHIVIIPNAIPDELPEPADPGADRIVAVGRLAPGKGFHQLIAAFARIAPQHPSWTLHVVGNGPQRGRLRELIARHDLAGQVVLRKGTPAVQDELRAASVFALSSRFESFGMVLLEAMATGLAVVSYACNNGPREILTDERNALLVRTGDVPALARQLERAMDDHALRERLGRAARADVRTYTVSRVTDRWAALLQADARGLPRRPGADGHVPVALDPHGDTLIDVRTPQPQPVSHRPR